MSTQPKWDTLTRSKKALPRVWDSLTPELRRKLFVGNTFTSFKLWRKLAPKEVRVIIEKLHYKKDVEKICKQLQKFLVKQEKENQSIEENTWSSKTKSSSKKSKVVDASSSDASSKSTKKSNKKSASKSKTSTHKKTTKHSDKRNYFRNPSEKVVEIFAKVIKTADCPKCKSKKGHRCIYIHGIAGHPEGSKRNRPHKQRVQKVTKSSKKAA